MVSDEYAFVGSGGLKLKGAKVTKSKKKKKKNKQSDLEKNLSTGEPTSASTALTRRSASKDPGSDEKKEEEDATKRKEGSEEVEEEDEAVGPRKTEAERRFEERRRKRLLELSDSSTKRPELLKTHKERVEELNTYLSKLSEHHDMPKIGPG
ncbi:DUF1754-domain-containing protein [Sodiomyces alkalinus F11]|uniref:DUF1754-domain-containing protein n=1 Tax=Sodiomyces alkalinus (strain CBS 110278 / VKM F-3762 / F11) TaxID=1314773 RepID=A0A3N2PXM2_SODAK|nr:DUF1754-domain-containing protein [Sodiomyces alkalinus F11]ROT39279.1 DUF1754-domain-containing protein [Sodiomyces alkalinus F11]